VKSTFLESNELLTQQLILVLLLPCCSGMSPNFLVHPWWLCLQIWIFKTFIF